MRRKMEKWYRRRWKGEEEDGEVKKRMEGRVGE